MERSSEISNPTPTKAVALYALYRVAAIESVAGEMGITSFRRIKSAGEKYSKDVVPPNMAYIEVDPGEKVSEFWGRVDVIAPPPTADEIKSGKFPR